MWKTLSHSRCSTQGRVRGPPQLARCVDCKKPLFNQSWKDRLKGQLRSKLHWPSKKRHDVPVGRYVVKQRCAECQEPLRCSDCSEAFFGNLSPEEIRVFIKAMVLYAMKGLCGDCNHNFKQIYEELFNDDSGGSPGTSTDSEVAYEKRFFSESEDEFADPKTGEIRALKDFPNGERRKRVELHSTGWRGGVALGDWKREIHDLLGSRFQFER